MAKNFRIRRKTYPNSAGQLHPAKRRKTKSKSGCYSTAFLGERLIEQKAVLQNFMGGDIIERTARRRPCERQTVEDKNSSVNLHLRNIVKRISLYDRLVDL